MEHRTRFFDLPTRDAKMARLRTLDVVARFSIQGVRVVRLRVQHGDYLGPADLEAIRIARRRLDRRQVRLEVVAA